MGKRKERRLAALSNAGRRVKLDLFAEPSGDLGGSSAHEEAGGDINSKHGAGVPNSPSSSGQQPENPLVLLGQYSDDELDDEANRRNNHSSAENSPADHNNQVKELNEYEDMQVNVVEDNTAQQVKQHVIESNSASADVSQKLEGDDRRPGEDTASGELKNMDSTKQNSIAGSSDIQVVGDVGSGWKIVMHEASDQYYYWNIETGETSWEVPDVLAQGTELTKQKTSPLSERVVTTHESSSGVDGDLYSSSAMIPTNGSEGAKFESQVGKWTEGYRVELSESKNRGSEVSPNRLRSGANENDGNLGNENSTGVSCKFLDNELANEDNVEVDLPSRLVKYGEHLLQILTSLKGGHVEGLDWISKYILEVEIRLSDLRSLLSCGLSLVPFWMHSERQLKKLEEIINDKVYQFVSSQQINGIEAIDVSKDQNKSSIGDESESDRNEMKVKDSRDEAPSDVLNAGRVSLLGHESIPLESGVEGNSEEVNRTILPGEFIPRPGIYACEDVDNDVDMEVEDAVPESNTAIEYALCAKDIGLEQKPVQSYPVDFPSPASEDGTGVPPPPDEDWIPPPPPDNEPIPPPPPDEPPQPPYPPPVSYSDMVQPLSYAEQYNVSYPSSSFVYYGQETAEVSSNGLYGHDDRSQMAVPHPSLYYEAVPDAYNIPVIVNPVQTTSYYDLQNGEAPQVAVISSIESSGICTESGPVSYGTLASDQNGTVDAPIEVGGGPLPFLEVDNSSNGGIEVASAASVLAPATISPMDNAPVPSTDVISAAAASAAPTVVTKVQSKVLRSKKRTIAVAPTLRSNKKVSSLVDKWKAAKEELHEDEEDEPEDALEALEKKKQREIEEWRAQQIASGEAKENANFQPLGGDWRERVKRRRAQLAREAKRTPTEAHTDENQPPDLLELSRDLPSGWQAYWDESSKQLYYGNAVTSETTWTKPA